MLGAATQPTWNYCVIPAQAGIKLNKIPFMVSLSNHSINEPFDKLRVNGRYLMTKNTINNVIPA